MSLFKRVFSLNMGKKEPCFNDSAPFVAPRKRAATLGAQPAKPVAAKGSMCWPDHIPAQLAHPMNIGVLGYEACVELLEKLDVMDRKLRSFDPRATSKAPKFSDADKKLLVMAYNHMLEAYCDLKWLDRDNGGRFCGVNDRPKAGEQVPNYFANVHNQTIHRRKVLSMAGLRNLVIYGHAVYDELRAKLFIGDPMKYEAKTGPHKMRYFTGNVVDLDTPVLRATDPTVLRAVNAMNEKNGAPTFDTCEAFAESEQAAAIARASAVELLARFGNDFKLSKKMLKARRVDPADIPEGEVPKAKSNSDRGKKPLWRYVNVGQDSFHANVPHIDDVVGALLRAPIQAVAIYLRIHIRHARGSTQADLDKDMEEFFTDCIADACFNHKWKVIEEFERRQHRRGTLLDVLERLHMEHQVEFMDIMDVDDERFTLEKELLWKLAKDRLVVSRTDRRLRRVHRSEIDKWVERSAQASGAMG